MTFQGKKSCNPSKIHFQTKTFFKKGENRAKTPPRAVLGQNSEFTQEFLEIKEQFPQNSFTTNFQKGFGVQKHSHNTN
jgi:hypothetical protein